MELVTTGSETWTFALLLGSVKGGRLSDLWTEQPNPNEAF